jgi:hypothetical protein
MLTANLNSMPGMMWNGLYSDQEYGPNKVRPMCGTHVVLTVKDGVNKKLLEKIKHVIVMYSVCSKFCI